MLSDDNIELMWHLDFHLIPVHEHSKHWTFCWAAWKFYTIIIRRYWSPCWKCLHSVTVSGAIWHIGVPKCQEVQITMQLEMLPLLHATTGTRWGGVALWQVNLLGQKTYHCAIMDHSHAGPFFLCLFFCKYLLLPFLQDKRGYVVMGHCWYISEQSTMVKMLSAQHIFGTKR